MNRLTVGESASRTSYFTCLVATVLLLFIAFNVTHVNAAKRPNIILVYADDISARELPLYRSSVWSKPSKGNTTDKKFLAKTPVLDQLAEDGCWVKTAWASVVCSPSRAMMMTGRYAHLHKWWNNSDKGRYIDDKGKAVPWPLYKSSPNLIGHVAQQAGYATYWAGKTQMAGDLQKFGFDQGCFTPGNLSDTDNPYADFKMVQKKIDGEKVVINADTGKSFDTYPQHSWYFNPHVRLMNHDDKPFQWWPNTPESKKSFGMGTYGPDIELDFIFDFMERKQKEDKPFFVYHTTHLGHGAFDWVAPSNGQTWTGTPKIKWDGNGYTRTEPHITGDEGVYDTHGTVTETGIHTHIEYLDYQMWLYRNKLKAMGIEKNTIIIFCADNGTSGYGKNSADLQKGTHVPLIIYAPGMTKQGEQDVLVNMSDMLPTVAELAGAEIPEGYEVNGKSLVPLLFTDQAKHREWIYGYSKQMQIIRGDYVMKDGRDKWWDVSGNPDDLISFPQIKDWSKVSDAHRKERDSLMKILPKFDLHATHHDAPSVDLSPMINKKSKSKNKKSKESSGKKETMKQSSNPKTVIFRDDFENRNQIGSEYTTNEKYVGGFSVKDGVLIGKQVKDDHGSTIRKPYNFADIDVEFNFRFNGGQRFNFVMDDKKEKSVHAGHICRVSISPRSLKIGDDKTGVMNSKLRAQRQDKKLGSEDRKTLEALLATKQTTSKIKLEKGRWHHLRVRIKGDVLAAFLNGEKVARLQSPGFAHPTKTQFGFTVTGSTIDFDNLKVNTVGVK